VEDDYMRILLHIILASCMVVCVVTAGSMHEAVMKRDWQACKQLLENGADLHEVDEMERTPASHSSLVWVSRYRRLLN